MDKELVPVVNVAEASTGPSAVVLPGGVMKVTVLEWAAERLPMRARANTRGDAVLKVIPLLLKVRFQRNLAITPPFRTFNKHV
jgi:hypothetical protein